MRLRRLDLTRYGRFTDHRLDFGKLEAGAPDFHVVYGLNEAGKTTTLAGFLDLLFGIEERSAYNFLHDYRTMEVGGVLEWNGAAHELVRRKQRSGSLTDPSGRVVDEGLLAGALSGLGREAYRTMFSLDDETLEAGGDAILQSRGDLGEMLFSASSGLGKLGSHLAKLSEEAATIHKSTARSSTQIAQLKSKLKELKEKRDAIDTVAASYSKLTETLETARAGYETVMEERRETAARLDRAERASRALPLAAEAERLAALLAETADLPRPPPEWARDLPGLIEAETRLRTLLDSIEADAARLGEERAALTPDAALLAEGPAITRLAERLGAIRGGARELPDLRRDFAERQAGFQPLLAALGRAGEGEPARLLLTVAEEEPIAALTEARGPLTERLDSTEAELSDAEEAEARERQALDNLPAKTGADLQRVAMALGRLRDSKAPANLAQAEREANRLASRRHEAFETLRPWSGEPAELSALALPEARRIEAWRASAALIERRREAERERLREAETRLGAERARLTHLTGTAGAIGDAEALAVRRARDAAWAAHRSRLDDESAAEFEARLAADDRLGAARLSGARDLAEMREAELELARAEQAKARAESLLAEAVAERQALAEEIIEALPRSLRDRVDDPARLADRVETFAKRREAALLSFDAETDALDRAEEAAREIADDRRRLEAALEAAGIDAPGDADELGPFADAALQAETRAEGLRQAAERRLAEASAALQLRRRRRDEAEAGFAAWAASWDAALSGTWIETRDVAAVRGILARLRTLAKLIAERDTLARRIEDLSAEQRSFAADVAGLAARLGEAAESGEAPEERLERLAERLQEARREAALRAAKDKDLADLTEKRRGLEGEWARLEARRAEMLGLFGLSTLAEVREAVERDAERRRMEARLTQARDGLLREMRAATPEAALEALLGLDPASVEAERAELASRDGDLVTLAQTRFAERTAAESALARVGGDDAVARIQAERQTVLIEMEEAASRWLRLKAGLLVAQGALAAFRENHRSTMMARASEAFAAMTRGAYRGLSAQGGRDRETLIGIARDGASKLAETMSKGTRFQLYLALRLAGYEEFASARTPVPFVADDIMETFDEPRSEEVLRLLAELSRRGQVVYLTHHRHLCDIARSVEPQVRVHEI